MKFKDIGNKKLGGFFGIDEGGARVEVAHFGRAVDNYYDTVATVRPRKFGYKVHDDVLSWLFGF